MATTNPVPPNQPNLCPRHNFDRLVQGAQQTTDELGKLRNLPAFSQGQAILQAIHQLGAQFNTFNTQAAQLNTQVTQNHNNITQQINQLTA